MSTVFKHRFTLTQFQDILDEHNRFLAKGHAEDAAPAVFENEDLCGREFSELVLSGVTFRNCDLETAKFLGCTLTDAYFEKCSFYRSPFRSCQLVNAVFKDCTIKHSWMTRCNLNGAKLPQTKLTRCDLRYSHIQTTDFSKAELRGVDFAGCEWGDNKLTCDVQLEIKLGNRKSSSIGVVEPESEIEPDEQPLPGARIEA